MDLPASVYVASALVPIAYNAGCWLWNQYKDIKFRKKLVLVLPKKGGKSTLNKTLQGASDKLLIIDLDEVMKLRGDDAKSLHLEVAQKNKDYSTEKILKMELIKDNVEYVKSVWLSKSVKNRALFLSSDIDVCKSIFKESSICLALPSDKLYKEMCEKLSAEDAETLRVSRLEYLKSYNPDQYKVYNSFEGLNEMVRSTYGLTYKA